MDIIAYKITALVTFLLGAFLSSFSVFDMVLPASVNSTVAAPQAVVSQAKPAQHARTEEAEQSTISVKAKGPAKTAASVQVPIQAKTKNSASAPAATPTPAATSAADKSFSKVMSKRVAAALPQHTYYNLHAAGNSAVFFAFDPNVDEPSANGQSLGGQDAGGPFRWYRMPLGVSDAAPELIALSEDIQLFFGAAVSPDGKELILTKPNGEIAVKDISKSGAGVASGVNVAGETIIGTYNSKYPTGEFPTYNLPVYSPNGKYLILHNRWENTLLVVDAKKKNIGEGRVISRFWLEPSGGESPLSGTDISMYEFSEDGSRLTFGKRQVLNLLTMRKE